MKRVASIAAVLAAAIAALILFTGADGDDGEGPYLVRAVFDNGAFVVEDEDVRIGGANVGSVHSIDVSMPEEPVSRPDGPDGPLVPEAGKAIAVLEIKDPGFQDFRSDATCIIRAQALVGEKFIDCRPTLPRAPGSPPPPPLEQVADGPGEGQYLLPLENNGKTVDVDLVNNINRRPYAERFRLLLNSLGAGFAARGEDVSEIIRRANPTLRDTDRVLAILTAQRNELAELAADSETILRPLARERRHVSGFFTNAGIAGEASAQRGAELEASFERFPTFLAELRSTMASLQSFSEGTEPVMADFNRAADDLTIATKRFKPFLGNSIPALRTLGDAGDLAGEDIAASLPTIERLNQLGRSGQGPLKDGAAFLGSLRDRKGFENLMDLIYNTGASVNGFDSFGHTLRSVVQPTNCVDYTPLNFTGCSAKWKPADPSSKKKKKKKKGKKSALKSYGAGGMDIPRLGPAAPSDAPISPMPSDHTAPASPDQPMPTPAEAAGFLDFLLAP